MYLVDRKGYSVFVMLGKVSVLISVCCLTMSAIAQDKPVSITSVVPAMTLQEEVRKAKISPPYLRTAAENTILNSEYFVPYGTGISAIGAGVNPAAVSAYGAGAAPIAVALATGNNTPATFRLYWAGLLGKTTTVGGWESALWWLRDLKKATIRIKVNRLEGHPVMTFRFYQRTIGGGLDNDFWAYSVKLSELPANEWKSIVLNPSAMQFTPVKEKAAHWEQVNSLLAVIEGQEGDAVILDVESPVLETLGGTSIPLWDGDRRLAQFDSGLPPATASETLASGQGRYLLGKGGSLLSSEAGRQVILDLKSLIPELGLAANTGYRAVVENREWLRQNNIGVTYQQGGAFGLSEFISEADAWLVSPSGLSRKDRPGVYGWVGMMKYYDFTSAKVWSAFGQAFQRAKRDGIGDFQVIESYWPWVGGFWSQGDKDYRIFREDLAGTDEGLKWLTSSQEHQVLRFWDYFEFYSGFRLQPTQLGLKDWSGFTPPVLKGVTDAKSDEEKRAYFLMMALTHYELLKFYNRLGEQAEQSGIRLATVPNNENYNNGYDLLGMLCLKGLKIVGHEHFGNPWISEPAYMSGGILRSLYSTFGKEMRMVIETNATGAGGRPYYDSQVAYTVTYDLMVSEQPDSVENDWLSWHPDELATSEVQRERYADYVLKGKAWMHSRSDQVAPPPPQESVGLLASRRINDINAGSDVWSRLLWEQSLPRVQIDLSEARVLKDRWDPPKLLVDNLAYHTPEDRQWIVNWLQAKAERVLVTYGSRLGKSPDGTNYCANFEAYAKMNDTSGAALVLGAAPREEKKTLSGTPESSWIKPVGEITLKRYFHLEGVVPLVSLQGQPVVSSRLLPNGARIIYLHYEPDAATQSLDAVVLKKIAEECRLHTPVVQSDGLLVHIFNRNGGRAVVAYDATWLKRFKFVYDPNAGIRLKWKNPATKAKLILTKAADQEVFAVDELTGKISRQTKGQETITLTLDGVGCGLWQIVNSQAEAERLAARAETLQPYLNYTFQKK